MARLQQRIERLESRNDTLSLEVDDLKFRQTQYELRHFAASMEPPTREVLMQALIIRHFHTPEKPITFPILKYGDPALALDEEDAHRPGRKPMWKQKKTLHIDEARIWLVLLLVGQTGQTYERIKDNFPWTNQRIFREANQQLEELDQNGRHPQQRFYRQLMNELRLAYIEHNYNTEGLDEEIRRTSF